MSDDLIERLEKGVRRSDRKAADNTRAERALAHEAAARIRELESACYRLTEACDALEAVADKDHQEVLVLRARLKTAEADAMERAARVLARASEEIRALKPKAGG